jgi:hypothetical protein
MALGCGSEIQIGKGMEIYALFGKEYPRISRWDFAAVIAGGREGGHR